MPASLLLSKIKFSLLDDFRFKSRLALSKPGICFATCDGINLQFSLSASEIEEGIELSLLCQ